MSDKDITPIVGFIEDPIEPPTLSNEEPVLVYTKYTEITLPTTEYTVIASPGIVYTIKNRSGNPVYVKHYHDYKDLPLDLDQQLIGGAIGEVNTVENDYTFVRASVADSVISIRPSGAVDPTSDVVSLGNALNDLIIKSEQHFNDKANPHEVTKEQVGLGNLPNAKSDDINDNDTNILATTVLTHDLLELINAHIEDNSNPHEVTKAQVGLGNVDNFPTADADNLDDCLESVDNKFVTPEVVYRIARIAAAPAYSLKPQMVVQGAVGELDENWLPNECDYPPAHTVKKDNTHVRVKKGMKVSYAVEHKTRISEESISNFDVAIDTNTNGYHYVFVNLDLEGFIVSAGETTIKPIHDTSRNGGVGDFFNYSENIMFNSDDEPITRVYVASVVVDENIVTKVIPIPIGSKYVVPLGHNLVLSGRFLLDNPFITGNIQTTAEVLFRNGFAPTEWNDQIGVKATPHYADDDRTIVVQCGQMGFLACGRESGSSFGSAFTTVDTNLRTRIVIERTLF